MADQKKYNNTGAGRSGSGSTRSNTAKSSAGRSRTGSTGTRSGAGHPAASRSSRSGAGSNTSQRSGAQRTRSNTGSAVKSNTGRAAGSNSGRAYSESRQVRYQTEEDNSIRDEIGVIFTLLISILLVLSYLDLCGSFGKIISDVIFGLFGGFGYIFPAALFIIVVFCIANRKNKSIAGKTFCCIMLLWFSAALVQLALGRFEESNSFADYYIKSKFSYSGTDKTYGGFFGGIICKLLCPYVGNIGAICIVVAGILIFFVLIVGKAVFTTATRNGIENIEEHRRVRAEENERRRIEAENRMAEEDAQLQRTRRNFAGPQSKTEIEEELDDEIFREIGSVNPARKKEKQSGFIDKILRSGMDLDIERIADTPEYKQMQSKHREQVAQVPDTDNNQTGTKDNITDITEITGSGDADGRSTSGESEDYVSSELDRKFGGKRTIEITALREHPVVSKVGGTGMTRTVLVDEEYPGQECVNVHNDTACEPENNIGRMNEERYTGEDAIDVNDSTAEASESTEGVSAGSGDTRGNAGGQGRNQVRTSSGATSFTTPEQLEKLEQQKPVEPPYVFPPLSLLNKGEAVDKNRQNRQELKETAEKLQQYFHDFNVGVTVTDVTCGPTVTRYEVLPDQGVKVKTITALADDIKLKLAAVEIRIEAPIPGKAAVGIEVPNKETTPVLLRDLLESAEFRDAHADMTFAVGKDIAGKPICADVAALTHVLIAGATGSGKSVCLNSLIISILYKAKPSDVKIIMIDPKKVELMGYNGIPHLLIPVVNDVNKAVGALNWAIAEMEDRYSRIGDMKVNSIDSYNRVVESKYYEEGNEGECPDKMPHILIIIDELADLMMTANCKKEIELAISRLTQKARAAGIHVVIATQRPSVNVVTGIIKANIPSRIAFMVSSNVDSRTILDQAGAEKLLGKGDMLFSPNGYPKPIRLQGPYVSDREINAVVGFIKSRCKEAKYNEKIVQNIERSASDEGKGGFGPGEDRNDENARDEFFEKAGRSIIERQNASIGRLQREFKIGFNRAARIMDQLADAGVVGPEEGTKPRKILMNVVQFEALLNGEGSTSGAAGSGEDYGDETGIPDDE